MINADTLQHSNAREIGAEWICYNSWEKLQLTQLLLTQGFTEEQAKLAATQVISRAVYPASELKTTSWIKENSVVCELTGYDLALHSIFSIFLVNQKNTKDSYFNIAFKDSAINCINSLSIA
jgi:hypothetical protein